MKITNLLDAGGFRITNQADPTSPQDSATKAYVDAAVAGYKWKEPVRAATTANITLSGAQTIDGVSVIAGDRVLVKSQTTASGNGIYVAAAGAWTRATDFDAAAEVVGAATFISEGTANGNQVWLMTTDGPVTLNTTSLVFAQIGGGGGGYSAGTGLALAGSVFSIDPAVTARRYAATIGDNSSTTLTVTHNLNTQDVVVSVRTAAGNEGVIADWVANGVNTVQLTFGTIPTTGQYKVVIVG